MSNPYSNQQWGLYGQQNMQVDPNYAADVYGGQQGHPQRKQRQAPAFQSAPYPYSQQQAPSTSSLPHSSSSLQDALQSNQVSSHSRSSSYNNNLSPPNSAAFAAPNGGYVYGNAPVNQAPGFNNSSPSFSFGATNPPAPLSMNVPDSSFGSGAFYGASPSPQRPEGYGALNAPHSNQQPGLYRPSATPVQQTAAPGPSAKRPRSNDDDNAEDLEAKADSSADKDPNKNKPARACARCKNLKVRCEAKTENEPCKRCLNGGHECFIPGRKIRRVPPKREHLINQIQSQAKEIERLMQELENAGKNEGSTRQTTPASPTHSSDADYALLNADSLPSSSIKRSNAATNKAIEDWIAKTRENMQELSYICVSGAGVPESYLVEDYPENSDSSGDEEFADVPEEFEGDLGGEIHVAVQDPDGGRYTGATHTIRHKVSSSSMGTQRSGGTNATSRKKHAAAEHKPANLPAEAAPFGLFGSLSLKSRGRSRPSSEVDEEEDNRDGIVNQEYFRSSEPTFVRQMLDVQHQVPPILAKGLITPAEAETLFGIFYAEMHVSLSLLDPVLYDAKRTFWRSPFLFTVICAISSRFYEDRKDLYPMAMQYAQHAAANALIAGTKNVDMCAAYILLSLYPTPVKRWAQQRSWLYLGLAIRIATDLNLHLPVTAKPKNENHAREMLNRTRIWLNCFNLDRSTGSQYGKPPTISNNDYTAVHSEHWWNSSPHNMKNFDIHIAAYNAELRLMSNFVAKIHSNPEHPTGLNKDVDFEALATETDEALQRLKEKWFSLLDLSDTDPQNTFRNGILSLAYSYARLVSLSYGFQHAFGKNDGHFENPFLMRCLSAATDVVNALTRDVPRTLRHYYRHGPEAQSVFATFASAFLVKLLQPKFASYLSQEQRIEIRNLVQRVIDLLSEVALDDKHSPKLYSRFLTNLLAQPLAKLDPSAPDAPAPAPRPRNRRPKAPQASHDSMDSIETTDSRLGGVFNQSSPAASSPSPPPAESVASFNNFRPMGGIDPYAPDDIAAFAMNPSGINSSAVDLSSSDFFKPELPFDNDIVRSFQDLNDPSAWHDISMPGLDWMSTFQQNLGMDLRSDSQAMMNMQQQQQPHMQANASNLHPNNYMYDSYLTGPR